MRSELMKPKKTRGALAAICIALALSPVAAFAQTSPAPTPPITTSTRVMTDDRDEHHDYGWIGLLGLLGLAGLMRKKHDDHRHDTTAGRTDVRR